MVGKQIISVLQLIMASRWLGEGDLEERRKLGLPRRANSGSKKSR